MTTRFYNEDAFFEAWRTGVGLAGPRFFGEGTTASVTSAVSKYDLAPDHDLVTSALGVLSSGEAVFLASMYSFYNSDVGGKMLGALGVTAPGDVAACLDESRRRVIADLLVAYAGW